MAPLVRAPLVRGFFVRAPLVRDPLVRGFLVRGTRSSEDLWSEEHICQRNTFVRGPFGQRNPLVRGSFGQRNPLVRAPLVRGPFSSEYFNQRYPFRQRILQIKVNVLYSETKHDKSSKENIA